MIKSVESGTPPAGGNRAKIVTISICAGTGCRASGAVDLAEAFQSEIASRNLGEKCRVKMTGCHGFCEKGPLVVIHPREIFYHSVGVDDVQEILSETVEKQAVIKRLLYRDPATKKVVEHEYEVPFYAKQERIVFRHNGKIDPTSIDDYLEVGGYSGLEKALKEMSPEEIIAEIKSSGLRGRGGGGFPAGRKWEICRSVSGDVKYVICNGDEGDPGAFMDRSIMEGNPHAVIEGMSIGAYAMGCGEGFIYVRAEYPLAVANLEIAIEKARERGYLGRDILGKGFDFEIEIFKGAGAFVCGEETALIASLEGEIGNPRSRPPFPAQSGLWGKPTNINNVETWVNVPVIIERGAAWYAGIGTENSKGTKVFSLVGKVRNTGLVEVPMGMTLREIVHDIGGGTFKGRKFKAVQTGGPSGGCIPESHIDLSVDFDELTKAGAMMGSGGLIVMDDHTCTVDIARYFTDFLVGESCGKCIPCREGLRHMLDILTDICEGRGNGQSIETLERIALGVKHGSLCGLGTTAANPVLSTLKYFREEYEAHIRDKKCPAGACKLLTKYIISEELCKGCGICIKECPAGAIAGERKEIHVLSQDLCTVCGVCYETCPFSAIEVDLQDVGSSHAGVDN
jgi:NADH-quinone oxidoreductase subunit F